MSEYSGSLQAGSERREGEFDRDLDLRGVLWVGLVLALITIIAVFLMWILFKGFDARLRAMDPAPSPLVDRSEPRRPPAPNLQTAPELELAEMRAEETARLDSYGWVDEEAGIARIPIDRALELYARQHADAASEPPAPNRPQGDATR